jgi:osmotically inducible protein OsmC
MAARASAEWRGDLKGGSGEMTVGERGPTTPYTFKSRFEDGTEGSNPEQLIGAAEAACFSMQLAAALAEAGTPATSVRTEARVQLRNVDGTPAIDAIELRAVGEAPNVDAETFARLAEEAKDGCIVSRALGGVREITLEAELRSAGSSEPV